MFVLTQIKSIITIICVQQIEVGTSLPTSRYGSFDIVIIMNNNTPLSKFVLCNHSRLIVYNRAHGCIVSERENMLLCN